ncbi:hypothetical protein [Leclercia adecarboxylata]|uniref:hypothetical protein n=1 Tax=Leclercia adecarboxylata TaxID=83655 RepID=UPI0013FDE94D|nr:hypothetical protein [Leclercia adecarboxylata]QIM42028.1 hypothetical protein G7098_04435 [Leclercia adecarboxylata]
MAWYDITGTVSDWIMAGVAVYAAANANQWFSQRSHTKGFDKAEELLANIDEQYGKLKNYTCQLHGVLEYLNAVNDKITYVDANKSHEFELLILTHKFDIQKIDDLNENLEMLERWSLQIINKELMQGIIKKLRDTSVSAYNASSLAKGCMYNAECIGMDEFRETLTYFKAHYEEYLKDLAESEQKYLNFKKSKFVDLFQVK